MPNGSVVVVGATMPPWIERLPMTGPDDRVVHVPSMTQGLPVENQSARTVILNTEIEKNTAASTEIARVLGPGGLVFTSGALCSSAISALCHDLNREGIIACANLPGVPVAQNGVRSIAVRPLSHDARLLSPAEQQMLEEGADFDRPDPRSKGPACVGSLEDRERMLDENENYKASVCLTKEYERLESMESALAQLGRQADRCRHRQPGRPGRCTGCPPVFPRRPPQPRRLQAVAPGSQAGLGRRAGQRAGLGRHQAGQGWLRLAAHPCGEQVSLV